MELDQQQHHEQQHQGQGHHHDRQHQQSQEAEEERSPALLLDLPPNCLAQVFNQLSLDARRHLHTSCKALRERAAPLFTGLEAYVHHARTALAVCTASGVSLQRLTIIPTRVDERGLTASDVDEELMWVNADLCAAIAAAAPRLQQLHLGTPPQADFKRLTPYCLAPLQALAQLRTLTLRKWISAGDDMEQLFGLGQLTQLTKLDLTLRLSCNVLPTELPRRFLQHLARLHRLSDLSLALQAGENVDFGCCLGELGQLQRLTLLWQYRMRGSQLQCLTALGGLREVRLPDSIVDGEGVEVLARASGLVILEARSLGVQQDLSTRQDVTWRSLLLKTATCGQLARLPLTGVDRELRLASLLLVADADDAAGVAAEVQEAAAAARNLAACPAFARGQQRLGLSSLVHMFQPAPAVLAALAPCAPHVTHLHMSGRLWLQSADVTSAVLTTFPAVHTITLLGCSTPAASLQQLLHGGGGSSGLRLIQCRACNGLAGGEVEEMQEAAAKLDKAFTWDYVAPSS